MLAVDAEFPLPAASATPPSPSAGATSPAGSPRTQPLGASEPREGGGAMAGRRLHVEVAQLMMAETCNAISAPSPPAAEKSPRPAILTTTSPSPAPPQRSPTSSSTSASSDCSPCSADGVCGAIIKAIRPELRAMAPHMPLSSMALLSSNPLQPSRQSASGSEAAMEVTELDVLLPHSSSSFSSSFSSSAAAGPAAAGPAAGSAVPAACPGGEYARLRSESVIMVVRPAALAGLISESQSVLPKSIRAQVEKVAKKAQENARLRQDPHSSQEQLDKYPMLLGYDVTPMADSDNSVFRLTTFWSCPVGNSVPLQRLLQAPRHNKCAVLRAAITRVIPGLCASRALKPADVICRTELHRATGGGAVRTVERLQVALPGGGGEELWASKGVEVALSADEQEALAAGVVALPAGFSAAVREADACVALTEQVRRVRGEEVARRCFPAMYGWDVLETSPGSFKFVTYMEWMEQGSAWDHLGRLLLQSPAASNGVVFDNTLDALGKIMKLLNEASRAGVVMGDFKLQNVLFNGQGEAKLADLDGGCPLAAPMVAAALALSRHIEASVRATCTDPWGYPGQAEAATAPVWATLALQPALVGPYMSTPIYAAPEFFVGWALEWLAEGLAAGLSLADILDNMWLDCKDQCTYGARDLVQRLQRECDSPEAAVALLSGMGGCTGSGRSYMCGASHTYLLGGSMAHLLWTVRGELSQRVGPEWELRLAFLEQLHDGMLALLAAEPAARPNLQAMRRWLAEMRARWC
ncbi:hypothetical protein HYH02_012621 [Chlamydomonas schloesseri]|uniref:Protein kinase domain-containing protein n=1 Tax=Chlamydomonas schloesseri TaxID=2026947 RepID=A0A835T0F7_9CHLO|nr:hypothetical protein HYH02_012621 [Chlamydomonas schloesseri]|eukprot:KAG2433503.1 hypothetical protein HYH02_012621 [Chlamydomonas schloesseri]